MPTWNHAELPHLAYRRGGPDSPAASCRPGQGPDLVDKILASVREESATPRDRWMRQLRSHYRRWDL